MALDANGGHDTMATSQKDANRLHHRLIPHPTLGSAPAVRIAVEAARSGHDLTLRYALAGTGEVLLPAQAKQSRADGLWQHTCFEVFVRTAAGGPYFEFNFSPSTEWAAYRFRDYRIGMEIAGGILPRVEWSTGADSVELHAHLNFAAVAELTTAKIWQLGLSAVIEEQNGRLSYWALSHPAAGPDFHHPDCFVLTLPAPLRP